MRIKLNPGINSIQVSGIRMDAGQVYDIPNDVAGKLIGQRIVTRADVSWISNDRIVVVDVADSIPVGRVVNR